MSRTGIETNCLSPNFLYVYVYVFICSGSWNPRSIRFRYGSYFSLSYWLIASFVHGYNIQLWNFVHLLSFIHNAI